MLLALSSRWRNCNLETLSNPSSIAQQPAGRGEGRTGLAQAYPSHHAALPQGASYRQASRGGYAAPHASQGGVRPTITRWPLSLLRGLSKIQDLFILGGCFFFFPHQKCAVFKA